MTNRTICVVRGLSAFLARGSHPRVELAGSVIILWRKGSTKAHLYTIAVDPKFQGRGLGRKLLERCLKEAHSRGCDRSSLEARVDNKPAIALYEQSGNEIVGRSVKYYEDDCDALQMQKWL